MYQRRRTPSFSSSLLDAICHSIDESKNNNNGGDKILMKKQRNHSVEEEEEEASAANLRRAIMIENWMQKQSSLTPSLHFNNTDSYSNSTTSSSSDAKSFCRNYYKEKSRRSKLGRSMKCMQFDKRIVNEEIHHHQQKQKQKQKPEDGFTKTKLRKLKQPISPGGRFTSFLNSIFSSGNAKKVNVCSSTVKAMKDVNFDRKSNSTCTSRSCLSNSNNNNDIKSSVRFYPVSVIVDEDSRPCGHKCIYEDDPSLMPFTNVQDIVKKKENGISEFVSRAFSANHDDDDEDDALSYSSSDLFELDHLIGIARYRDELPVYETTILKKNIVHY